jgi:hypothetical protein
MNFKIGDKVKLYESFLFTRELELQDKVATIIGIDADWFIIKFDFELTGLLHNAEGSSDKEDCYYVREQEIFHANIFEVNEPFVIISISTLQEMVKLLGKQGSNGKLQVKQELQNLIDSALQENYD